MTAVAWASLVRCCYAAHSPLVRLVKFDIQNFRYRSQVCYICLVTSMYSRRQYSRDSVEMFGILFGFVGNSETRKLVNEVQCSVCINVSSLWSIQRVPHVTYKDAVTSENVNKEINIPLYS